MFCDLLWEWGNLFGQCVEEDANSMFMFMFVFQRCLKSAAALSCLSCGIRQRVCSHRMRREKVVQVPSDLLNSGVAQAFTVESPMRSVVNPPACLNRSKGVGPPWTGQPILRKACLNFWALHATSDFVHPTKPPCLAANSGCGRLPIPVIYQLASSAVLSSFALFNLHCIDMAIRLGREEWDGLLQQAERDLAQSTARPQDNHAARLDAKTIPGIIDHTLLKLDATEPQIDDLCAEAKTYSFKVWHAREASAAPIVFYARPLRVGGIVTRLI